MILILLTLLPFTSGSVIEQKSGFIGEDVLLPCNCSEDLKQLAWQRDLRMVTVYPEDKSNIDPSYMGRTQLFLKNEKKNCSLLLLNFSMEDEGVYTCFRIISVATGVSTMSPFKVNLTAVFEKENKKDIQIGNNNESDKAVSISVPILVVAAIPAAVLLVLLLRKRHRRNIDTDLPAKEQMLEEV